MASQQKPAKKTAAKSTAAVAFTEDERAAMKDHAAELKAAARRNPRNARADGEADVLAKISEMTESDRPLAERLHALIKATAPELEPRLYYGMPAYAKEGKVLCHFQPAKKFKSRYATFNFSDVAILDDGTMWPTSFALTELTPTNEAAIGALIKKAVS